MSNRYHHGDLRNALVQAGLEILERDGPEALTLRACAASVGVSHAAPRNHFRDVRDLRSAIAAEGFRRHAAMMRSAVNAAGADRSSRLRAAGNAYVRFALTQPNLFKLMFDDGKHEPSQAEMLDAARESYAILEEVAAGLAPGDSTELPGNLGAELYVWSIVHGFAHLAITAQFGPAAAHLSKAPELDQILPAAFFE